MSAIGPGDFVECIRSVRGNEGRIFRCVALVPYDADFEADHGPCGGIEIDGQPSPNGLGWAICCFRPIYRPKPDTFTDLLTVPSDDLVSA